MSDHDMIPPALAAEEWQATRFVLSTELEESAQIVDWDRDTAALEIKGSTPGYEETNVQWDVHVRGANLPKLIALANAALPDGDSRKVTREDVDHLRYMGEREISADEVGEMGAHAEYGHELIQLAAKLASLLPPR